MTGVILDVPLDSMPELVTASVETLPTVSLIEVLADSALIARRTNFALASDTTRFSFHSLPDGRTEVRAEYMKGGAVGFSTAKGVVGGAGREMLDALVRASRARS